MNPKSLNGPTCYYQIYIYRKFVERFEMLELKSNIVNCKHFYLSFSTFHMIKI